MRKIISKSLLGALLGFTALMATQSWAVPITLSYTGSIETWTAAVTGTYRITAIGAQGGHGTIDGGPYVGGRGAMIEGTFDFTAGDIFSYAVGEAGSSLPGQYNGGGGGGSFFVDSLGDALIVAGGGGGIRSYAGQNGFDASITAYGVQGTGGSSTGPMIIKTTDLGQGGDAPSSSWGSAGAGFYSDGANDTGFGEGGKSWANGLLGGIGSYSSICDSVGGFGGGGSGSGCGGGGGGGGYSGGDGGYIGGGGGSWNTGTDQVATAGVGYGDGSIIIELISSVSVPEPTTLSRNADKGNAVSI